jgi:hypothetical protein
VPDISLDNMARKKKLEKFKKYKKISGTPVCESVTAISLDDMVKKKALTI